MQQGHETKFRIVNECGETEGSGKGTIISKTRAAIEAIAMWLTIWAITVPFAFVPIVHLAAVPAGIFGGIILPIFVFRRRQRRLDIRNGIGPCPKCQAVLKVQMENISKECHWGVCTSCQMGFSVPCTK